MHMYIYIMNYINSLTWNLRPFWDDSPQSNHDSRVRKNSEVVIVRPEWQNMKPERIFPHWRCVCVCEFFFLILSRKLETRNPLMESKDLQSGDPKW